MDVDLTEQRPKFAICVERVIQLSKQKVYNYGKKIYMYLEFLQQQSQSIVTS